MVGIGKKATTRPSFRKNIKEKFIVCELSVKLFFYIWRFTVSLPMTHKFNICILLLNCRLAVLSNTKILSL